MPRIPYACVALLTLLLGCPIEPEDPLYADVDGDGYSLADGDCDDDDDTTHPDAGERCDGLDNDCDGELDFDERTDVDNDGWLDCEDCEPGNGSIPNLEPCP